MIAVGGAVGSGDLTVTFFSPSHQRFSQWVSNKTLRVDGNRCPSQDGNVEPQSHKQDVSGCVSVWKTQFTRLFRSSVPTSILGEYLVVVCDSSRLSGSRRETEPTQPFGSEAHIPLLTGWHVGQMQNERACQ